jgi:hypothetical protein
MLMVVCSVGGSCKERRRQTVISLAFCWHASLFVCCLSVHPVDFQYSGFSQQWLALRGMHDEADATGTACAAYRDGYGQL